MWPAEWKPACSAFWVWQGRQSYIHGTNSCIWKAVVGWHVNPETTVMPLRPSILTDNWLSRHSFFIPVLRLCLFDLFWSLLTSTDHIFVLFTLLFCPSQLNHVSVPCHFFRPPQRSVPLPPLSLGCRDSWLYSWLHSWQYDRVVQDVCTHRMVLCLGRVLPRAVGKEGVHRCY